MLSAPSPSNNTMRPIPAARKKPAKFVRIPQSFTCAIPFY
jgi:hypothetical protein